MHVLDRTTSGPKPDLVEALGATYQSTNVSNVGFEPDIIMECTGVGQLIAESFLQLGAGGIVCLTGVGTGGAVGAAGAATADIAAAAVLGNKVVIGSVNASKRHWYQASQALARADRASDHAARKAGGCHNRQSEDIKVVVQRSDV